MRERVRVFTDTTGTAHTAIKSHLEEEINAWLAATAGEFVAAGQSESRSNESSHLTIAVWYRAEESARRTDPQ
jgi:hypothetical protein